MDGVQPRSPDVGSGTPMRRLRVLIRVWLRFVRRYLSGRRWTVLLPDRAQVARAHIARLLPTMYQSLVDRRKDNRDLLTGVRVAYMFGPMPHWEMPYRNAFQPRPVSKGERRWVGRPLVTRHPNGVKIGETEWWDGYVSRKEQLASRKMARKLKQGAVT